MGSAVCHQMAERSFIVEGMQMPFCARCTGIYIGAFFAFCYFFLKKRMYGNTFTLTQAAITGMMILPIGIDGTGSYLGFWESSQGMRIFTGSLVGAVTPGFLLMAGNFEPQKENESLAAKLSNIEAVPHNLGNFKSKLFIFLSNLFFSTKSYIALIFFFANILTMKNYCNLYILHNNLQ